MTRDHHYPSPKKPKQPYIEDGQKFVRNTIWSCTLQVLTVASVLIAFIYFFSEIWAATIALAQMLGNEDGRNFAICSGVLVVLAIICVCADCKVGESPIDGGIKTKFANTIQQVMLLFLVIVIVMFVLQLLLLIDVGSIFDLLNEHGFRIIYFVAILFSFALIAAGFLTLDAASKVGSKH